MTSKCRVTSVQSLRPAKAQRVAMALTLTYPYPPSRYLSVGRGTRGLALLGPENAKIAKDPSWIVR